MLTNQETTDVLSIINSETLMPVTILDYGGLWGHLPQGRELWLQVATDRDRFGGEPDGNGGCASPEFAYIRELWLSGRWMGQAGSGQRRRCSHLRKLTLLILACAT